MSSTITEPNTEADILARAMASEHFPPDVARSIVALKIADADQVRVQELCDKNNKGTITDAEHEELRRYERVGTLLAILQSKARKSLKHDPPD